MTTASADETLGNNKHPGGRPDGRADELRKATLYLTDALKNGRRLVKEVTDKDTLDLHGLSKRTVERASYSLGVRRFKETNVGYWELIPMHAVGGSDDVDIPAEKMFGEVSVEA